jgi:hypothetical protein
LHPHPGFHQQETRSTMITKNQTCSGTFTLRNHNAWIFDDAAEVMFTLVIITDEGNNAIHNKKLSYGID